MISKAQFVKRINRLPQTILSKTRRASYTELILNDDTLTFKRVNTGMIWSLSVDDLYKIYLAHNFIDTSVIKKATQGRVNSPSIAVLMAIGCIDKAGNRMILMPETKVE